MAWGALSVDTIFFIEVSSHYKLATQILRSPCFQMIIITVGAVADPTKVYGDHLLCKAGHRARPKVNNP
jgi:hypothetical protein